MPYKKSNVHMSILLSIFIISLSLFTYQITLTRLYSAILFHHYVFLVTSFAILGVGLGSVLAYRDNNQRKNADGFTKVAKQVGKGSFILSCGFIAVFVLIYVQPFIDSLLIYIALGIIPFVISGYLYAVLFKAWAALSGKLYFADLIGAGVGSIIIVSLLDSFGMFRTVILICLMPLIVVLILQIADKKLKIMGCLLSVVLGLCLFLPVQSVQRVETDFYALLNNSGKTYGEMRRSGLEPEIVFSRWDSFARTDLIRLGTISEVKILTIDGSANAPMYVFDGDIDSLYVFKTNTGYIPFIIGENEQSLIIGAGGGRGVLYALAAGSTDITAVEINPASIEAARQFGEFNGHIFDRPEVRTYIQDGRNFVRTTEQRYDIIFLSLVVTNTAHGAGFALSENYIHTVEAIEDYLDRLNYSGRIAFVTHDQDSLVRLTTTAIQALVNRGVPLQDAPEHIAIFYYLAETGRGSAQMIAPVIIVMNEPFTLEKSTILMEEILNIGAIAMYIPHVHELGIIAQIQNGQISFEQFIGSFNMRAEPVTDNSPYFFNFERGVPSVLLQILVLSLVGSLLLFAPFVRKKGIIKPSIYFGLLGMGFMMVQIPFIQMFILYLGHPTLAFSYVLAAMLIGCGIGGFLSPHKLFKSAEGRVYLPPVLAAVIIFALLLSLNFIFRITSGFDSVFKVVIAAAIVLAPGIFMGMPFPRGMTLLGEGNRNDIIPVMWGINGTLAVTGSVLSIILSMTFGFNIALLCGVAIYLVLGFFKEI